MQAFLYMQELKDAEELVNEYRDHPPKIGWRTVFVQYSQYTRLDVGQRKPDVQVTYRFRFSLLADIVRLINSHIIIIIIIIICPIAIP